MNENLNLIELLKDCPIGTKLYSSVHGEVELEEVHLCKPDYPIEVRLSNNALDSFTTDGRLFEEYNGECMLFPSREQRDWSKIKLKCLKSADAAPSLASLWHDASEEPRYEEFLLAEESSEFNVYKLSGQEDNNSWKLLVSTMGIIRWAYIDDLLSKQFGNSEQLKGGEK